MMTDDLPLLDVFTCLREKYNFSLGVEEYLLVLHTLRARMGWENRQALQLLCCMLWAKSEDEADLVCRVMDRVLSERAARLYASAMTKSVTVANEVPSFRAPAPRSSQVEGSLPDAVDKNTISAADTVREGIEPVHVVQAIRRSAPENAEVNHMRFQLQAEYFPVTRRQMKQSWRHMRRKVREGLPEEFDMDATVRKTVREGVLLEPVLLPRRINRAVLVMLIDQGGSMIPFHSLSRQLRETAQRDGRLGQTGVYYFHDYPANFLYRDPSRVEGEPTSEVLAKLDTRAAVLIISDAGAARGKFDAKRLTHTENFIQQLEQSVRYYAWLNPMPSARWIDTTAGAIARLVPMFEMSRQGLDAAISTLRGRNVSWEKLYPWMI